MSVGQSFWNPWREEAFKVRRFLFIWSFQLNFDFSSTLFNRQPSVREKVPLLLRIHLCYHKVSQEPSRTLPAVVVPHLNFVERSQAPRQRHGKCIYTRSSKEHLFASGVVKYDLVTVTVLAIDDYSNVSCGAASQPYSRLNGDAIMVLSFLLAIEEINIWYCLQ